MYISRPHELENSFCRHTKPEDETPSTFQLNAIKAFCSEAGVSWDELCRKFGITEVRTAADAIVVLTAIRNGFQGSSKVNKVVVV
jgi:hypothetical protein